MPQGTVAVVTGANSGIGRAIALHLADQGHFVYGTVRSPEKAIRLRAAAASHGVDVNAVELDVTDETSVRQGIAELLDNAGHIDVLVNNAGASTNGVTEESPPATYFELYDVNVCGPLRCIQAVLPTMRERGSGTIVNISSIAGRVALLGQAPYVASKWALEGLTESLAQEVAPFGIRVTMIEPGVTKSAIYAKTVEVPDPTGPYEAHYRRMFQMYKTGLRHATDPFEVAETVHHAITTDQPRLRHLTSWGAEIAARRPLISDEDWVALGAVPDDDTYYQRFVELFGRNITPSTTDNRAPDAIARPDRDR